MKVVLKVIRVKLMNLKWTYYMIVMKTKNMFLNQETVVMRVLMRKISARRRRKGEKGYPPHQPNARLPVLTSVPHQPLLTVPYPQFLPTVPHPQHLPLLPQLLLLPLMGEDAIPKHLLLLL